MVSLTTFSIAIVEDEGARTMNSLLQVYTRDTMPFDHYLEITRSKTFQESLANSTRYQSEVLQQGFGHVLASQAIMTGVMVMGFLGIRRDLAELNSSINEFHADFNWAAGEIISRLELQHKTSKDILDALEAPLETQAKELRKRAEYAYANNWFEEALRDYLSAEKYAYQDFVALFRIATIHLYHIHPPDLDAAKTYYLKSAKYAAPVSKPHEAYSYMYAGFVCYLLRQDEEAISCAQLALAADPKLDEAQYNLAKFATVCGQFHLALESIEDAIRRDRRYAIKACLDNDFAPLKHHLEALLVRFADELRPRVINLADELELDISALQPNREHDDVVKLIEDSRRQINDLRFLDLLEIKDRLCESSKRIMSTDTVIFEGTDINVTRALWSSKFDSGAFGYIESATVERSKGLFSKSSYHLKFSLVGTSKPVTVLESTSEAELATIASLINRNISLRNKQRGDFCATDDFGFGSKASRKLKSDTHCPICERFLGTNKIDHKRHMELFHGR